MTRSSSIPELRRAAAIDASAEWPVSQAEVLEHSAALLKSLLEDEDRLPSGRDRDPDVLIGRLPLSLPARGLPLDDVFARLDAVLQLTPSSSSWRFLNQLFGGREPVAVAAESMALWRKVSMYTFKAAGAQVLVENALLSHMLRHVGFTSGVGIFVPGGSLANLAALLLARDRANLSSARVALRVASPFTLRAMPTIRCARTRKSSGLADGQCARFPWTTTAGWTSTRSRPGSTWTGNRVCGRR